MEYAVKQATEKAFSKAREMEKDKLPIAQISKDIGPSTKEIEKL